MKYSVLESSRLSVSGTPVTIPAKPRPWTVRLVGDVGFFIRVNGVADNTSFYAPSNTEVLLAVPSDNTVSVMGAAAGFVNACNVQISV